MSEPRGAEVAWDRVIAAERERDEAYERLADVVGERALLRDKLARVREEMEAYDSMRAAKITQTILAILAGEDE